MTEEKIRPAERRCRKCKRKSKEIKETMDAALPDSLCSRSSSARERKVGLAPGFSGASADSNNE